MKNRLFIFFATMLVLTQACAANQTTPHSFTPTEKYKKIIINGFSVYLAPELESCKNLKREVENRLKAQFDEAIRVLPKNRHAMLRETSIWVELNVKSNGFMEYHWEKDWLVNNGYNPEKFDGIEISNAKNYLKWSVEGISEATMLHELAHSLFFKMPEKLKKKVRKRYHEVLKTDLYKEVERFGKKGTFRAWALEDEWEYLSELTEAYFGTNDFFPHTRSELKEYDPIGFDLVQTIWNEG